VTSSEDFEFWPVQAVDGDEYFEEPAAEGDGDSKIVSPDAVPSPCVLVNNGKLFGKVEDLEVDINSRVRTTFRKRDTVV